MHTELQTRLNSIDTPSPQYGLHHFHSEDNRPMSVVMTAHAVDAVIPIASTGRDGPYQGGPTILRLAI
jgi:hypothetical protein